MDGNYIETNNQFSKLMGYPKKQLKNMNVRDFMPEEFRPEFDSYLERIKINGAEKGLMNVRDHPLLQRQGEVMAKISLLHPPDGQTHQ